MNVGDILLLYSIVEIGLKEIATLVSPWSYLAPALPPPKPET
jgi:hypothetical protein